MGFIFQNKAQLDAYLDSKYFNTPQGAVVETYIEIYANTIQFSKPDKGTRSSQVEVIQVLKKEDSIVNFSKTILKSEIKNEDEFSENLLEVKRFSINNKEIYTLEVSIKDLNLPDAEEQMVSRKVLSNFSEYHCEISDIQLVASFAPTIEENILSKSGYDLVPLISDFFSPEYEKIVYYFEVYNTTPHFAEDKFIVSHYIESKLTNNIMGSYGKTKRESAQEVIPVLNVFDIKTLPSGDYNLVAEIRDKENQLIVQKKVSFTRLSLEADLSQTNLNRINFEGTFVQNMMSDSLSEYIYCLYPIVSDMENRMIDNQVKKFSDTLKRQFIYSFWFNMNSRDPQKEWETYKEQVDMVNKMFGTKVRQGYETDRGRVYLKYGPPFNVEDRPNEPSSYPYQIWHYYKIGRFNNKRFVFYQPDLVTNDYSLLHSDLQGEIQNFKWQKELNSRNTPGGNIDDPNEGNYNHYGTNSGTFFEKP